MKATFQLGDGRNSTARVLVVLQPESADESLLLDLWARYEANVFSIAVERGGQNRLLTKVVITSSDSE